MSDAIHNDIAEMLQPTLSRNLSHPNIKDPHSMVPDMWFQMVSSPSNHGFRVDWLDWPPHRAALGRSSLEHDGGRREGSQLLGAQVDQIEDVPSGTLT